MESVAISNQTIGVCSLDVILNRRGCQWQVASVGNTRSKVRMGGSQIEPDYQEDISQYYRPNLYPLQPSF